MAKQLQYHYPWMVNAACAAHCLALACKDASTLPCMQTFKEHLQQLHAYVHNSCNRTAVLQSASMAMGPQSITVQVKYIGKEKSFYHCSIVIPFFTYGHRGKSNCTLFSSHLFTLKCSSKRLRTLAGCHNTKPSSTCSRT